MMKCSWIRKLSCAIIFAGMICSATLRAEAANTLLDVPDYGWGPDNLVYENLDSMIQVTKWGYGTNADIINTIGISASIKELNENATPQGGKSTVSIYTNGVDIAGSDIDAVAAAGWDRLALYYYDYVVEGDAASGLGDQAPRCSFTEDQTVANILKQIGFENPYAMISLSGWNLDNTFITLYTKNPPIRSTEFYAYKYDAENNCFEELQKKGYYADNYFCLLYTKGDGIYIATDNALTDDQKACVGVTVNSEESPVEELPESKDNTSSESETVENPTPAEETLSEIADRTEEDMETDAEADLSDFIPEATIEIVNDKEVAVSFAYDGELPEEAQVKIGLPFGVFKNGTMLHLFYCNPENETRELVDSQICTEGTVTFTMNHCSDYIITSVLEEKEGISGGILIACVVGAIVVVGSAVGVIMIRKKQQKVKK